VGLPALESPWMRLNEDSKQLVLSEGTFRPKQVADRPS
jgi:hypothetical protein